MKRLLFLSLVLALASSLPTAARVINPQDAQNAAIHLIDDVDGTGSSILSQQVLTVVNSSDPSKGVLYVYNIIQRNSRGRFVIVSAEDAAGTILAYGDGLIDVDNIPEAMQSLLDYYREQIEYLQNSGNVNNNASAPAYRTPHTGVEPLLKTKWGQGAPYYGLCPLDNDGNRCLTGCGATALAQVMKKWEYPLEPVEPISGYTLDNVVVGNLLGTQFDWDSMLDSYDSNSTEQQDTAVATLMRYAGQAQQTTYGKSWSGSSPDRIAKALKGFGYNASVLMKDISGMSDAAWTERMLTELDLGQPIIYYAVADKGHIFDVDGYKVENDSYYFHINWGWKGNDYNSFNSNGYFILNNFTGNNHVYDKSQQMVLDIIPIDSLPPEVTVDSTALSFEELTGYTLSKSFIVRGNWLKQNIDLSISGDDQDVFTITPTTITPEEAARGAKVTVSYSPTWESGETSAAVIIDSETGQLTVNLTGKPIISETYLEIDKDILSFSDGHTGYAQTQTFTVTAAIFYMKDNDSTVYSMPLRNNVVLTMSNQGASCPFKVSPKIITPQQAYEGCPVTVTYFPETDGECTGSITVFTPNNSYGDPVISLYGKAGSGPAVRASASSLSFNNWHTGYEISDTIIVSAYHTTGDVELSLDNPSGSFTISRTIIPADSAGVGVPVIVTYYPIEDGQHSATLTLTNPNAEAFTINLTGNANSNPSIEYDPASLSFEEYTGHTQTKSFMLKAYNLTQDVTLQVNGQSANHPPFTVSPGVIGIEDADQGAMVSVTYIPSRKSIMDDHASIGFTSSGVNVDDLQLEGHGIATIYSLSADSTSLSFSTTKGNPVSQTMNLTHGIKKDDGYRGSQDESMFKYNIPLDSVKKELPGITLAELLGVYATIDGDEGFELDEPTYYSTELGRYVYKVSNISFVERTVSVTVIFNPESNHKLTRNANLTFYAGGAKPVTVALTGTVEINEQQGDVNGDGVVTIGDVTALIDYLLSGDAEGISLDNADCNQDGVVTIGDVTALIDYLLSGEW